MLTSSSTRVCAIALALAALPVTAQPFLDVTVAVGLGDYRAVPQDFHAPGAVFADLDRDGWDDLFLIGEDIGGGPSNGALYRNAPGPAGGRIFVQVDLTLPTTGSFNGAIAGDYDNDGDLDLYLVRFGANVLLANRLVETGALKFEDVTARTDPTPGMADIQCGVATAKNPLDLQQTFDHSLTAAWADIDRDGDLDLYVGNHDFFGELPTNPPCYDKPGERDTLYRNNGDGTFTDITATATATVGLTGYEDENGSIETPYQCWGSTNAVIFADVDNDRWPDLLVSNKTVTRTDRDLLYRNLGNDPSGTWLGFEAFNDQLSPVFGLMSFGAMGVDVGDIDNDGDLDLYITDAGGPVPPELAGLFFLPFNDLWVNQLADTGRLDFLHSTDLAACWSWGAKMEDFDNDGHLDVHVSGNGTDFVYRNDPTGACGLNQPSGGCTGLLTAPLPAPWSTSVSFCEETAAWGLGQGGSARGDLAADYDCDGWVDLMVVNHNPMSNPTAPSALLENQLDAGPAGQHAFLLVDLEGDPSLAGPLKTNRDAIGARVRVYADLDGDGEVTDGEVQIREAVSGSGNAAGTSSLTLRFGLGLATSLRFVVLWPSGRAGWFQVAPNQRVRVVETATGGVLVSGLKSER